MGMTQPSDVELLARLRSGDGAAFALLRERCAAPEAGRPADGSTLDDPRPPDPVPDGTSTCTPAGPSSRAESAGAGDRAGHAIVLDAYATLGDRARAVLWLTEVEGRPPAAVGRLLGTTPPAAAALASRAREQLRHAYLRAHLHASPRPRCGRPPGSRLAGYVREGPGDQIRTATVVHLEACSSCQALVAATADAPRLLARVLAPWSSSIVTEPAPALAAAAPVLRRCRPVRALSRAGRHGSNALAIARGDPALVGTVAVAAALVVAVLASAFLPAQTPADLASSDPVPADEGAIVPAPPSSPSAETAPSTSMPDAVPVRPEDPSAAGPRVTTGPAPDRTAVDAPEPASATAPPTTPPAADAPSSTAPAPAAPPAAATGPTQPAIPTDQRDHAPAASTGGDLGLGAAAVASVPSLSSAVWQPSASRVEVTLVNGGTSSTGFLVVMLEVAAGALIDARPTGCALALSLWTSSLCTLRPLGPGASASVQVPLTVTAPGQSATVQVCAVGFLRLSCTTPLLRPTVVALD